MTSSISASFSFTFQSILNDSGTVLEPNELYNHICAMANTSGGFLVLGIGEIKSVDSKRIIGFEKIGFKNGEQECVRNEVGNSIFNIEPTPTANIEHIPDGDKFYTVIKSANEISKKPYFIKDKGQCYVRIGNSSRPASRSTILNLFSTSIEQRNNIEKLRVACALLKESLMHVASDISTIRWDSSMKIHTVDLSIMKNAILSVEWFLLEKNLMGAHTGQSSYTHGINSILHNLELFNAYADAYNRVATTEERRQLVGQLYSWTAGSGQHVSAVNFLDSVIKAANEFLSKYR